MARLQALQEIIKITFKQPSLLELAMVHSSYINENPGAVSGHNERLEFLGDAVLGFITAEKLYRDFPDLSEGEMTRLRSALVRGETLTRIARSIGLGDFLYLGKGEEASGGRDNAANLAGAMEAVIAAVFLDQGIEEAGKIVLSLLSAELSQAAGPGLGVDYKSRLQELSQSIYQAPPVYRLTGEAGPDHDKTFTAEVIAGDKVMGRGTGKSKKLAETEAARAALERPDGFITD